MTAFPSTEGFARGQNSEIILGGSIGLNRVLLNLKEWAYSPLHPIWDIYFINIYTVARNVWVKGIKLRELLHGIDLDTDLITTYLEAYHTNTREAGPPVIVFYVPTYEKIPDKYKRIHVGNTLEFDNLYDQARHNYPMKFTNISRNPSAIRFLFSCGHHTYPHKELGAALSGKLFGNFSFKSPRVFLFTHCPIDLHLYKKIKDLDLMESYTGQLKEPIQFGSKLIKEIDIPFNTYTHRLFGDSLHLMPLVTRKQKDDAIALAEKRKWKTSTDNEILMDIVRNLNLSEYTMSELKF